MKPVLLAMLFWFGTRQTFRGTRKKQSPESPSNELSYESSNVVVMMMTMMTMMVIMMMMVVVVVMVMMIKTTVANNDNSTENIS